MFTRTNCPRTSKMHLFLREVVGCAKHRTSRPVNLSGIKRRSPSQLFEWFGQKVYGYIYLYRHRAMYLPPGVPLLRVSVVGIHQEHYGTSGFSKK